MYRALEIVGMNSKVELPINNTHSFGKEAMKVFEIMSDYFGLILLV